MTRQREDRPVAQCHQGRVPASSLGSSQMFPIQKTWIRIVQRCNRIVPGAAEGVVGAHAVETRHVRMVQARILLYKDLCSTRQENPAVAQHGVAATEHVARGGAGISYREGYT